MAKAQTIFGIVGSTDDLWEAAFFMLANHMREMHDADASKPYQFAHDRACALAEAYAYAEGIAESQGLALPVLGE